MKIIIKIGTSTLTYVSGCINIRRIESLCKVISDLKNAGNEVIMVSSGAIAMGHGKLNIKSPPQNIAEKQAFAAVRQCELMYAYDKIFSEYNHTVAQILLTADDLRNPERHEKFDSTMEQRLEWNVIPIINENDTVSTAEIKIGDNDTLAAIVAESVGADLLVLMTDIDGLFDSDPRKNPKAKFIDRVEECSDGIMELGGDAGSERGTGGMYTKLKAAKIATEAGCDMIIMNGAFPENLYNIIDGKPIGTRFFAKKG